MRTNEPSAAEELAVRIATKILTVHGLTVEEGTRAQIMMDPGDGTEKNLGGRNKQCLVKDIAEELDANAADLAALRLAVAAVASELAMSAERVLKNPKSFDDPFSQLAADCEGFAERLAAALKGEGGGGE